MKKILPFLLAFTVITCGGTPPKTTLHWPDCESGSGNIFNATVILDIEAGVFASGTIVGVFDDSKCVGQELIKAGQNTAIAAWIDNPSTSEIDGATPGNTMTIRAVTDKVINVVERDGKDLIFGVDSVYVLTRFSFPGANDAALLARIDELEQSVVTLTNNLSAVENERDALQASIDILGDDLINQTIRITTLESDLAEANTKLTQIAQIVSQ